MSAPSFAGYIVKRPWLKSWMKPLANWYIDAAGYRKLGLRGDDLIPEESETVLLALKRLPPKEAYDRVFRLRRAFQVSETDVNVQCILDTDDPLFQCSLQHQLLPADQQTKPEEDVPYLIPLITEIEALNKERDDLDTMIVKKK
ncbi:MAG: Cytochrome b-c1 complex subunit 7 [Cirrosporium novae-zelandiae]|nr:MAG: Cytochrome b-c1 complex subunit 7 [Cirrosporium novae-zelandiae]